MILQVEAKQNYKMDHKHWIFMEYNNSHENSVLNSILFEMAVADIYDKVEFES